MVVAPGMSDQERLAAMKPVVDIWDRLRGELVAELVGEGFREESIQIQPVAYIRFYGQLEDVEVPLPGATIGSAGDVDALLARFEEIYTRMFTLAGKPDVGTYHVTEVCVVAKVETVKPRLVTHELQGKAPPSAAVKGTRRLYQKGQWHDAKIYRMENLLPGNEVDGLAVIEASNTTLFVPPEWHVRIDEYNVYWMTRKDR